MRYAPRLVPLLVATLSWGGAAVAQDAHYWNYGYGPIGQLTEGVLVGGVSDISAVYYNPGALALLDNPRFLVGLTSVEIASLDVPGAAGERLDVDQLIFDIVPSMVGGAIGEGGGANRFAVALLSRSDSDWDLGYTDVRITGAASDAGAGFGRARQRLVEYWLGGTWSHRFSERLSVGVSPFIAYREQRSRRSLSLQGVAGAASSALFVGYEHEYTHVRALAKAGLAWRPGSWELGMTVTSAGFGIYDTGKAILNTSVTGDVARPFVSASTQDGLDANYHAPWSVAAGATWRHGAWALHSTAEWFSSVDRYVILAPEPAPVSGSSETIPFPYQGESASVLNYGAGVERRLGRKVVLYGGVAHNESAYVAGRDTFAGWDLTDVTLGLTHDNGRVTLALGVGYAWGGGPIRQAVVPPVEAEPVPLRDANFGRWTISAGASFRR